MSQQEKNIQAAEQAYKAFATGDLDKALKLVDENAEWIQPGQSAISGTYRGRSEIRGLMERYAEKQLTVSPSRLIGDGDIVVAILDGTLGGERNTGVQVTTWRNGKLVRSESYIDTALLQRVFGQSRASQSQSNS